MLENLRREFRWLIPVVACGLLSLLGTAGCSRAKKDAADAALATSIGAFAAIREDAVAYAPRQSALVEVAIQSARDSLAKGDYTRALAVAKEIPAQIQELSASIKDRKDELREQWEDLTESVPALLRAAGRHIDNLNRSHKSTTAAREVVGRAQKQWQSANAAFTADELLAAVAKGNSVKDELDDFQKADARP